MEKNGKPKTLLQFWKKMEKDKIIIHGPNTAIKLQKGNKTILLFGESHGDIPSCGQGEKNFTGLFKGLMIREKCFKTDIVLELSTDLDSKKTNEESGKLMRLLKTYQDHYLKNKEKCNIVLSYGNPNGNNVFTLKWIKKFSNGTINAKTIAEILQQFLTTFIEKRDIVFQSFDRLGRQRPQIYGNLKPLIGQVHKVSKECYGRLEKVTDKIPFYQANELFFKVYNNILDMINIYIMTLALQGGDNVLIYGGALHIIPIAANLISFLDYKLTGFGENLKSPYEGYCVELTSDIEKGIKSLGNMKFSKCIEKELDVFKKSIKG